MTLDELYQECAMYVDETISKSGGAYTGTSLSIVNKFKTGLNYAYKKIAKERYSIEYKENIVLDSNKQFALSSLTKTFFTMNRILNSEGIEIQWEFEAVEKVTCPYESAGNTVTVYYYYIPTELSDLTDEPVFPLGAVDHKIMCFYAAYAYLNIEEESMNKANFYLGLFNDGFDEILQNRGEEYTIKDIYGGLGG